MWGFPVKRDRTHLPHANAAYQELYAKLSSELQTVYGKNAGRVVGAAGTHTIAMMNEMTELAYPNVIVPKDHK